ncbi:MAG: tetratricopeptide repeat protein [candidate division WOR-3 bacterium]|nr:tetratricopeptide repeat protein [candidate division WOR-3 bacterium]
MKRLLIAAVILTVIVIAGCTNQFISSGIIYMQQNETDKALEQFQLAVENEPNNPEAYMWLGRAYADKGEYEKAAENVVKALEADTTGATLKTMREDYGLYWAILYNAGLGFRNSENIKERFSDYETWLKTAMEVKDTILNDKSLIILYAEAGSEEDMVKAVESARKKNPEDVSILFNIAKYYIDEEEYDKARSYLKKAVKIDPDNLQVEFWLAQLYYAEGYNDEALKIFKQLETQIEKMDEEEKEELKNIYIDIILKTASIYQEKKDYKNAIIYYEKAYKIDDTDANTLYQLGAAYYSAKNYSKALEVFDTFLEKSGQEMSVVYLIKSDCLNKLGRKKEALEMYEKYEELKKQGK